MREIKFRYVLKVYNTSGDDPAYYEWLELPIFTLGELEHNGLDKWVLKNVEGIIETIAKDQYTGLEDKNGKEIYEGDVFQFGTKKGWKDGESERGVVVWHEKLARFGLTFYSIYGGEGYTGKNQHLVDFIRGVKIIGNIYENSELLKGIE